MGPGAAQEEDAVLIEQCRAGNHDAFRGLFERYREQVFRVAYRLVGSREDALDLTQETFVKAFTSLDRFRGQASFKTYLTRIAVNACLDFRRRWRPGQMELDEERLGAGGPREVASAGETDPAQQAQSHELQQALRQAVNRLPEALRATFLLHAIEGFTYREVAEALEVPVGTVMSRIYYARNNIRRSVAPFLSP